MVRADLKGDYGMSKAVSAHNPHIEALLARHADLESRIAAESARPQPDMGIIAELKRAKLKIKDSLIAG